MKRANITIPGAGFVVLRLRNGNLHIQLLKPCRRVWISKSWLDRDLDAACRHAVKLLRGYAPSLRKAA